MVLLDGWVRLHGFPGQQCLHNRTRSGRKLAGQHGRKSESEVRCRYQITLHNEEIATERVAKESESSRERERDRERERERGG